MRLLLDQGLPRSTVTHLMAAGVHTEHVGDLGMVTAADSEILEAAHRSQAVVVTLDADFHRLLAASQALGPSVIRLRVEGLLADQLATLLVQVIRLAGKELGDGAVVSVSEQRVRVRALPLGS